MQVTCDLLLYWFLGLQGLEKESSKPKYTAGHRRLRFSFLKEWMQFGLSGL